MKKFRCSNLNEKLNEHHWNSNDIIFSFGIFAVFVVANSNLSRLFPMVKLFLVQKIFRYWESAARIILPNITRYYQVCMNENIPFSKRLKSFSDKDLYFVVRTNTQSKSRHFQYHRHWIFGIFWAFMQF